jgi:four helix bundle protein
MEGLPARLAVSDQLERASTSIPLSIAEGKGKYTPPDRCRYAIRAGTAKPDRPAE